MIINGEAAVFGAGPAGLSCSQNLAELGLAVTTLTPVVNRAPRSVYTTSIEAAQTLRLCPDSVKPLSRFRVITGYDVDVSLLTPGRYYMVDNQRFIDKTESNLRNDDIKIIKLPKKTLNQTQIEERSDGVIVQVDGLNKKFLSSKSNCTTLQ